MDGAAPARWIGANALTAQHLLRQCAPRGFLSAHLPSRSVRQVIHAIIVHCGQIHPMHPSRISSGPGTQQEACNPEPPAPGSRQAATAQS